MTPQEQEDFIRQVYTDIFERCNYENIPNYFSAEFVEENNYDILRYEAFEQHVKSLGDSPPVKIDLEFLINVPRNVVLRANVSELEQIKGAPPVSLVMSHWRFDNDGVLDYCKEVEHAV